MQSAAPPSTDECFEEPLHILLLNCFDGKSEMISSDLLIEDEWSDCRVDERLNEDITRAVDNHKHGVSEKS
ncbi:hypothetical protein KCP78_06525 [Salmonella enterica subsp. enterica]|nr:hypothetical protein KCP78_06525 [Salmonella enterica subsp. enterica]